MSRQTTSSYLVTAFFLAAALAACGAVGAGSASVVALPGDLDGDGYLAPGELRAGLAAGVSAAEAGRLFTSLDRDHDGRLDAAEYDPDPADLGLTTRLERVADRAP